VGPRKLHPPRIRQSPTSKNPGICPASSDNLATMLLRLTGTLLSLADISAELELAGGVVAVEVALPAYATAELAPLIAAPVTLHARLTLEQQAQGASFLPRLTGFPDPRHRAFFDLFTSVRGVGGRKALRALAEPPEQIAAKIVAGDAAALQKLPEVGKKLAQTIITDIGERAAAFAAPEHATPSHASVARMHPGGGSQEERDAIHALMALGHSAADAERMVASVTAGANESPASADEIVARAFGTA